MELTFETKTKGFHSTWTLGEHGNLEIEEH